MLRIRVPDFRINTFKSFKVMPDTPSHGSSTKRSTPFNIHEYVATFFLPDSMLDYFDIVWAEEKTITRKHDERYKTEFHMFLDEKDNRPEELKSLRPNGFTEETVIDDFPVRNRKFILHVRRRRWLDDDEHSIVLNVYQLTADGTRLSEEFASFLKRSSSIIIP